jgi:hypothetical protein
MTKDTRLPRLCPRGRSTSTSLRRLPHRCHVTPNHVEPIVDVKSAPHAKHIASQISWLHTRDPGVENRKLANQFSLKLTKDEII